MSAKWMRAGLAVVVALVAGQHTAQAAAGDVRVELRCEGPEGPQDLRNCLPDSRLEIGRAGVVTRYRPEDLSALGDPAGGTLVLNLPKDFRVNAQNTGTETRLHLSIAAPSGDTVYTASAARYEWVQFTHCGPNIEPTCREYDFSRDGYGKGR